MWCTPTSLAAPLLVSTHPFQPLLRYLQLPLARPRLPLRRRQPRLGGRQRGTVPLGAGHLLPQGVGLLDGLQARRQACRMARQAPQACRGSWVGSNLRF